METLHTVANILGLTVIMFFAGVAVAWSLEEVATAWKNRPTYAERQARYYDRLVRKNIRKSARLGRQGRYGKAEAAVLAAQSAEKQAEKWRTHDPA